MKSLVIMLLFLVGLHAQEGVKKVVFDLTTGNVKVFEKKVLSGISFHKSHYESKLEELEVSVIIHGDANKFFLKNLTVTKYKNENELIKRHKEFAQRINTLSDMYDVEFLICKASINKSKINKENIYDYVKLVDTSTIGLINKQAGGYAYIPISK